MMSVQEGDDTNVTVEVLVYNHRKHEVPYELKMAYSPALC